MKPDAPSWSMSVRSLPFPSLHPEADFPTDGESVPVRESILLPEHQAIERRESEDRMRGSEWIQPSDQGDPQVWLHV